MKTHFHRLEESSLGAVDLVPHAIINVPVRKFEDEIGLTFAKGHDDLDNYSAMFFQVGLRTCAFIHYEGEPDDGMTLYLERDLSPEDTEGLLHQILTEYNFSPELVAWREREDVRRKRK